MSRVLLGVDRLAAEVPRFLPASVRRVGYVTSDGAPMGGADVPRPRARVALLEAGVPLVRLFSPEHGLEAVGSDGQPQPDGMDLVTGLPVWSLYGPRLSPPPDALAGLDALLFDLQDVGARFYTFLWTLSYVMEACAKAGIPLWVLDRPNPGGGDPSRVEGPLPDPGAPPSFLCRWPIPVRHGLTLGELALLLRREMGLDLDLHVVAMSGWRRDMFWPETGISFHPPSPGIPCWEAALLYPGLALFEATNVSVGRGTPWAFQWVGAPWLDPVAVARDLEESPLSGVEASPSELLVPNPIAGASAGTPCPGVRFRVSDPKAVRPVAMGLRLLALVASRFPGRFGWRAYPTAANPTGQDHLFLLLLSRSLVQRLEGSPRPWTAAELRDAVQAPGWWERAAPILLYAD